MHIRQLFSSKLRADFRSALDRRRRIESDQGVNWSQRQLDSVSRLWADAVADIPYYAGLVDCGVVPAKLRTWGDFSTIPILTRQILQDRAAEFVRNSGPPDGYTMTAGSTGTPLRLGMNQQCRDLMRIVKLTAWMEFGYTPAERLFLIWGHSHLLGTGWKGKINHWKRKLADAVIGYERVDAYLLNHEACLDYAERLIRCRPCGVIGYASALGMFARHTSQFRDQFRALGVRFILATAEPMPTSDTQEVLEDLFGCPVVQEYGGAEFGQVAFKIGAKPFDVYSDLVYLESSGIKDENSPGEVSLVTTLYPRYVPLFRYQLGDALIGMARMEHGHVKSFDAVAGRLNVVIRFGDGNCVHSVAIFHCIHQESSVHSIQMVLKDDGLEILLAGTSGGDASVDRRIRKRLTQVYPPLGNARLTHVEDILTNRSGKRRWFVDQRTLPPQQ